MDDPGDFQIDAELAFPFMKTLGWQIESIPWRSGFADWRSLDAVYIGTPWDYPNDPDRFLDLLQRIVDAGVVLVNDLSLVRWTLPKTYLRDLEQRGVAIVPSLWHETMSLGAITDAFDAFDSQRIVVKPVINTNAMDTYIVAADRASALLPALDAAFCDRPYLIQPFIESICTIGEFSLFFFDRVFSHAMLKLPKPGDFRVQEEYGSELSVIDPDPLLLATAEYVLGLVDPAPAYARIDFVCDEGGGYRVMELELIEPSMYLRMNEDAPKRFAEAFDRYVMRKTEELRHENDQNDVGARHTGIGVCRRR